MIKKIIVHKVTGAAVLLVTAIPTFGVNVIKNGDFKQSDKKGLPLDWKITAAPKMTMRVVDGGYDSRKSLQVKSTVLYGGGRTALRQFLPLVPNRQYELSCYSIGGTGGYLSIAMGNRWQQRLWIRGGKDWTLYKTIVICNPKQFSWKDHYETCLMIAAKCDAKVSNICLRPLNAFYSMEKSYAKWDGLYVVKDVGFFSLDITEIPKILSVMPVEMTNKPGQGLSKKSTVKNSSDLSAEVAFAADSKGLLFYAKVKDNKHFAHAGAEMWNGDSVQLGIEQKGNLSEKREDTDHEIGFSLSGGSISNFDWTLNRSLTRDEMEYTVKPINGGYLVIARISWRFLKDIDRSGTGRFSVNVVINDTDDGVQRKALSLAPGLYSNKSNKDNIICLLGANWTAVTLLPDTTVISDKFSGRLILSGAAKNAKYSMQIISESGKNLTFRLPKDKLLNNNLPLIADLYVPGKELEAGKSKIQIIADSQVKAEIVIDKKNYFKKLTKEFPLTKQRYDSLKHEINTLAEQHKATKRMKAAERIFDRQFSELDQMIRYAGGIQAGKDYNGRIGLRICRELNMAFDMIENDITRIKNGEEIAEAPSYVSSPRVLKDGYFEATVVDRKGDKTIRPVIFSGYGHFNKALKDIEWFPGIGVNFIQTEIGPNSVIVGENNDGSFAVSHKRIDLKCKALERAWKNNVAVNLLISPHYYPNWALKKHPESAWNSGSFLRYDVQDPYAKKLIGAYIKELISYVKGSPGAGAVHSICLSNEPKLTISLKRKQVRERFIKFLKDKYVNVSSLNSAWHKRFVSFDSAVPHVDMSQKQRPGLYYDFAKFKMKEFAEWHAWMATLVKEQWPGMPVHSKQLRSFGVGLATDYELFSKFSDVGGTDASDTFTQGLMTSMKPGHIVNSENHIIPDGHQELVSYEEIFQKIFRQFINGVGGSAVWVWEPYSLQMFEQKHALDGNIYRRPLNILAVYDASDAANRLVDEIKYGLNVKPEVAILYSMASAIDNPKYEKSCNTVWNVLERSGRKVGFISEDQLQQGKNGNCKLIIAPYTTNIKPATIKALNDFVKDNGKIVVIGKSFTADQYGFGLKSKVNATETVSGKFLEQPEKLLNKLEAAMNNTLGKLPVSFKVVKGKVAVINWCCTPAEDGGYIVYIENLGKEDVELKLSSDSKDMISGKSQPETFTLKPWGLKLLKVKL